MPHAPAHRGLSASAEDRRQTAGKCLGELVRKLGERVLPEIFPILRDGLEPSRSAQTRQGVCLGLAEVLGAARKEQLEQFLHADVVPAIRDALCDADAAVREAAGLAFDATFRHGGPDTAAAIVPALLSKLGGSDDAALEGLKQVLKAQPKILASVLPKLAAPPIDARRAETLAALAEVAGAALPPHLEALFPPLLAAMASEAEAEAEAAKSAASAVLRAVPSDAHYLLLPQVLGGARDERPRAARRPALCGAYVSEAQCFDEEDDVPRLIETLVSLFCDADEGVVLAAWTALGAVTGAVAKERQALYLRDVRAAVQGAREKIRRRLRDAGARPSPLLVPGLCLPKGLAPVAQVYLQGVLAGRNADARERRGGPTRGDALHHGGRRQAARHSHHRAAHPRAGGQAPRLGEERRARRAGGDDRRGRRRAQTLRPAAADHVREVPARPGARGPTESRGGAGQAGRAPAARRRARRRPNRVPGNRRRRRRGEGARARARRRCAPSPARWRTPAPTSSRPPSPPRATPRSGSAATPRTTRRARRRRSRSRTPPPGSRRRRAPTWPSSWARRRAATPTRASTARSR